MLMLIQLPTFDSVLFEIFESRVDFFKGIAKIVYSVITWSLHAAIANNGNSEQYPSAL